MIDFNEVVRGAVSNAIVAGISAWKKNDETAVDAAIDDAVTRIALAAAVRSTETRSRLGPQGRQSGDAEQRNAQKARKGSPND